MPEQGIMVEMGDAEEDAAAAVEVVAVAVEEAVDAPHRSQTIFETRRWQEDAGEWHLQEQDIINR
jgi:hypothetical protein